MSKLESEINEIVAKSEVSMDTNTEYHKGGTCPYKNSYLLCQEGWCSGCMVYRTWIENKENLE